ncbi:glycosyltransferase [Aspergillus tubingensis]|uniref:UDP-Glycosyltransferase/glycogen phosphorylase n=1 Tax=Aspergillus niger TaxID=5061 RepID=A0A100IJ48_ASPNG|nr:UDP-glycosyltransferase/glycogen phosphorylase [Aspergillus tubingensis]GAQ42225.1 UDP-Glycosyltransferase/glycogen phosphorylase [Aspergillus niger]GFN16857.1 UDP-glycosyltransferase/glycogen phosphorylase [Aspergillus tubingensis]GLA92353.1 hypothetical protein AtubIFM57143_007874 [Aspergillus tubingensis]
METLAPRTKFLVVVTAGGRTNATPLLEIARILSDRGHVIEFATLEGQQVWTQDYPFISRIHILGPNQTAEAEEQAYLQMSRWKLGLNHSFTPIMEARKYLECSWETVYPSLSALVQDPARRPNFIIGDYLVDAVRDIKIEHDIPIAMHWPQMPTNMLPATYIPGAYGLQMEVLTSEHATLWQRLQNYLLGLRALPAYLRYRSWAREQRSRLGIYRSLPNRSKPDHLLLVNSFFGLEPAKDLPPNVIAVGPILSDTYPGLTPDLQSFTAKYKRILYISLGTHALVSDAALRRILHGATLALQTEQSIDGVIWSIRGMAMKQFNLAATAPAQECSISDLVSGANPHIYFCPFVPQRALLAHPSVSVFLTHAGASSTNEAIFHGIRSITIGVYFDQISNAMKLRDAGVSTLLDRDTFTPEQLCQAINEQLSDSTGAFAANCIRLQRIARIASRRKYLAADLIEEALADAEGRKVAGDGRAMHLETADMRMPVWKARNWDLWALGASIFLLGIGVVVAVPLASRMCL